jgi:lipoate-protein ligase B
VHLVGFIIRKFVTMHGHVNVKKKVRAFRNILAHCGTMYMYVLHARITDV